MVSKYKFLVAAGAMLSLGGCALPPALEVASLLVGSGSWLVTGKGLTDHAVSAAVAKDCSMAHPLMGYDFCLPADVDLRLENAIEPVVVAGTRLKGVEHAVALAELAEPAERSHRFPVIADMNPDLQPAGLPFGEATQIAMVPGNDAASVVEGVADLEVDNLRLEDLEEMVLDVEMAAGITEPKPSIHVGGSGR